jgi:hypothetical protein
VLLRELRGLAPIVLITGGLLSLFIYLASSGHIASSTGGYRDLVEYWAAYRLLGSDPYSPADILQVQNQAGAGFDAPLMMWNPPWLPLLMPGLSLPFDQACLVWRLTNVTLWLLSGVILGFAYRQRARSSILPWLIFTTISAPALLNLQMGQMGSLLTFGAALVIYGWAAQLALTLGVGALLLSVKPHIFIIFGVYFLVRLCIERRWAFAVIALMPIILVCGLTYLAYPAVIGHWLAAVQVPPEGAIDPRRWMTPTIGRWIDILLVWGGLNLGTVASKTILLTGTAIGILIAQSKKLNHAAPAPALTALAVSILASPFSWSFDQMVLVLAQVAVLSTLWESSESIVHRWTALLAFAAINLIMLVQWVVFHAELQYYFWFPIAQCILCVIFYPRPTSLAANQTYRSYQKS